MTDHPCERCGHEHDDECTNCEGMIGALCSWCARIRARALINTAWQATTRRERRTYADMIREWEAR